MLYHPRNCNVDQWSLLFDHLICTFTVYPLPIYTSMWSWHVVPSPQYPTMSHNGRHSAHLAGSCNCHTLGSSCTLDPCIQPVHVDSLMTRRTRLLEGHAHGLILDNGTWIYKLSDSWQRDRLWLDYLSWVCSTDSSVFLCCCLWLSVSRTSTWYSSSPEYLQDLHKRSSQGRSGFNMACSPPHEYKHMI